MKKIFTCGLSLLAVIGMAACKKDENPTVVPGEGTNATVEGEWFSNEALATRASLNLAINDSGSYFITNKNAQSFIGLDGKTYANGDLLPAWQYMQNRLNIEFKDTSSGSSRDENFNTHSAANFANADIINGTVTKINEQGADNKILDLMQYISIDNPESSQMPNLSKFLKLNPTLAKSMQVDGKLFYSPYFDSFDEPEHFFIMNTDMVKRILDSEDGAGNTAAASAITYEVYNTYTSNARVTITVNDGDVTEARDITKQTSGKNAITEIKKASTGATMIANLKAHLRSVYGEYIGEDKIYKKLSDIFISESAAYDTDELVALMYCIKNNNGLAQGVAQSAATDINLMITRKEETNKTNQRAVNMIQGLGIMYGVRGALESKCNAAIYMDKNGEIQDGRTSEEFIKMFDYSSQLYADGIIAQNYEKLNGISFVKTEQSFMIYDYLNNSTNKGNVTKADGTQVQMQAVLPPVNNWDDGLATTDYFHFSDSTRSAKTETWAISANVAQNPAKLAAALTLFDYLFSIEGDMLMNYGPNATQVASYGGTNVNAYCTSDTVSSYSALRQGYINHPTMSQTALNAMNNAPSDGQTAVSSQTGQGWNKWSKAEMGANLPVGFVREFFAEYETMTDTGKVGYDRVSACIATGTYKTLSFSTTDKFFTSVPNITLQGNASDAAASLVGVTDIFSADNTKTTSISYVKFGWDNSTNNTMTKDAYRALLNSNMNGDTGLVKLYREAYQTIQ